ncbi:MAG: glycosyltransferase, partial [Dethiobacter sp.]|nr:glycosyltransferase [Dethiobacter sp.]
QLTGLNQGIAERDGRIASLNQVVAEREQAIAQAQAQLQATQERLSQQLAAQEQLVQQLQGELSARDGQLAALNQAVSERQEQLARLSQALAEREGQVSKLLASAQESVAQLTGLNQGIAERDGRIASLNQVVAEREQAIAQAQAQLQATQERLSQQLAAQEQLVQQLQGELSARDGQIAAILRSRSWRLSKPIRVVGDQLKRIGKWFRLPLRKSVRVGKASTRTVAEKEKNDDLRPLREQEAQLQARVSGLLSSTQEAGTQIASLSQIMAEREAQIISLNQGIAERDGWISSLQTAVAERDGWVASLNQAVAERDGWISSLQTAVAERDAAAALVSSMRRSASWRLTAPLRFLGHLLRGDLITAWRIVRHVWTSTGVLVPKNLSFFFKRQFSRLFSLSGHRADSTANPEALDAIIAERWAFTRETPTHDPLIAKLPEVELPNIDIGVVTYNSSRWVKGFVKSLLTIDYPKSRITIRFVDNGSNDSTVEALQAATKRLQEAGYTVEILQMPNRGFGAGHNVAIKAGDAPFCLVTNIDLTFERDTLSRLVATAMADVANSAAWEARQKPYEHPKFYDPITGTTNWNSHACVLLRRNALNLVGYYDETLFMYGEDVELSYRLRRAGFVLRYCPSAVVNHYSYEHFEAVKPLQYAGSTFANLYIRLKYGNRIDALSVPLMGLRLVLASEVFPGSRRLALRNIFKLAWVAPKALLSRCRSKAHFPFRDWDYEMIRDGASIPVPPLHNAAPLVSVITRTYRGREVFLRQALLSVAHQTYPKIEHIVVEDGGSSMREVVEGISALTGRHIRFIALEKVGRSAAGNAGLKASTGRWCLFLDDDDLLFCDHIEVLVNALYNQPDTVAAYSLASEVVTDNPASSSERYRELTYSVPDLMRQEFDSTILAKYNFMPIQSVLFDRNLFVERGGLPEDMEALEDWVLWNRYAQGNRFIYVPKLTSMYRTPCDPERRRQRQEIFDVAYPLALARVRASGQLLNCQVKVPLEAGR